VTAETVIAEKVARAIGKQEERAQRWHRHPVTLSSVVSILAICGGILPFAVWFGRGTVITALVGELNPAISAEVKAQTAPAKNGVKAMLQDKIDELATKVAMLDAKQRRNPQAFTDNDVIEMQSAITRLEKQKRALQEVDQGPGK
jgi:hypothetical protein